MRTRSDRTVGYDFTFSVPKSVSLLYAMSGDQGIMDAFRGAVDETMRDIETEMKTRVRVNRQDAAFLKQKAYEIAYPVLIKPIAGGGGKGMHRVDRHADFDEALEAAQREGQSAFGDARVLLEKVVVRPLDTRGVTASDRGLSHISRNLKFLGIDAPGALQRSWTVPAFTLHALPDTADLRLAALAEPLAVACHDVRRGEVSSGQLAVVIGGFHNSVFQRSGHRFA